LSDVAASWEANTTTETTTHTTPWTNWKAQDTKQRIYNVIHIPTSSQCDHVN